MNRRTGLMLAAVALLTTGCLGNLRPAAPAEFDFGPLPALSNTVAPPDITVTAPSWLAGTDMHYRLLHDAPARRQAYAESRWAAPPAGLLRLQLQRRLAGADFSPRCRLTVELVELEQVFVAPAASHVRLAAQARIDPAVQTGIDIEEAAPTADARGGVTAAGRAVERLATRLARWLATPAVAAPCNREANEDGK